jgi:hypothetical protein
MERADTYFISNANLLFPYFQLYVQFIPDFHNICALFWFIIKFTCRLLDRIGKKINFEETLSIKLRCSHGRASLPGQQLYLKCAMADSLSQTVHIIRHILITEKFTNSQKMAEHRIVQKWLKYDFGFVQFCSILIQTLSLYKNCFSGCEGISEPWNVSGTLRTFRQISIYFVLY